MSDVATRVETVVITASAGRIDVDRLRTCNGSLMDAGLDSMEILAVIMGLEAEFGIAIDVNEDASFLMNVRTIADFVDSQLQLEIV